MSAGRWRWLRSGSGTVRPGSRERKIAFVGALVIFPVVLLGVLLALERVEQRLRVDQVAAAASAVQVATAEPVASESRSPHMATRTSRPSGLSKLVTAGKISALALILVGVAVGALLLPGSRPAATVHRVPRTGTGQVVNPNAGTRSEAARVRRPEAGASGPGSEDVRALLGVSVHRSGFGLRASIGCRVRAALQASSDGGVSWRWRPVPAAHLLRVAATGPSAGWVVGGDENCAAEMFSTRNGGRTWSGPTPVAGVWVAVGDAVLTPQGTKASPCSRSEQVGALAPDGYRRALVVCGSRLLRTTDGGVSWSPTPMPAGKPIAVAANSTGRVLLALAGRCRGLALSISYDTGSTWGPPSCAPRGLTPPIGLALTDPDSALLTSPWSSYLSSDGGNSWRRA